MKIYVHIYCLIIMHLFKLIREGLNQSVTGILFIHTYHVIVGHRKEKCVLFLPVSIAKYTFDMHENSTPRETIIFRIMVSTFYTAP